MVSGKADWDKLSINPKLYHDLFVHLGRKIAHRYQGQGAYNQWRNDLHD